MPFEEKNSLDTAFAATLPTTGYLRLPQIIGDNRCKPPKPPLIPVSKSTWWAGVKSGRFPAAVKLGPKTTAWKAEDIAALIKQLSKGVDK